MDIVGFLWAQFWPFVLGFFALSMLAALLKTPQFKGWWGERSVRKSAEKSLDPSVYHSFHDVMLESFDGTTQIDHIFVSKFGVFVVETKHMGGWIFGGERRRQWTQTFPSGSKFRFQNPLHQNHKHIKTLENVTDLPIASFHNMVVFSGAATFKTVLPRNVCHLSEMTRRIREKKIPLMSHEQIVHACDVIRRLTIESNRQSRREHVAQLKARHKQKK